MYNIYPKWMQQYEINIEDHNKIFYTYALSLNPNSIKYLEINIDKINWCGLSKNVNAIKLLKCKIIYTDSLYLNNHKVIKNIDLLDDMNNILESDIDWYKLSHNQNAISLLKKNKDKI